MSIEITPVEEMPDLLVIHPRIYKDERGFFLETFHKKKYADAGLDVTFVQDNHSRSAKGVLRGLHYQVNHAQGKLIYVASGSIYDIALDIRKGSPTFGKWYGLILSSENAKQFYIPEGFAHGFCTISDTADVTYKCTDLYYPDDEYGILWNDPGLNIEWPVKEPKISTKDKSYLPLSDIPDDKLPAYRTKS